MKTVSSKVPFEDLCRLCERILLKSKKDEKRKVLSDFIANWREFHTNLHKTDQNNDDSFYSAMRLLLPQFERERGAYGIKETMLAKLYIDILNLSKESEDAKKLLNYRTPKTAKAEAGDFASVAEMVLKHRCPDKGTLKISDVNYHLDNVALCNAEKKKVELKGHLKKLLCNTTAQEQKWLIRMILKDVRTGLSETSVLNVFHPDAKDLFDVTSSLSKVCRDLHDPAVRLHEIEISMFTPFRPMLANRAAPEKIEKMMNNNGFLLETKLDGERMQLHKNNYQYKYFSRSGIEYTQNYGESSTGGSFTPFIASAFKCDVKSFILDGEMVGWNKQLSCIGSKGQNFDVKVLPNNDPTFQPCFCVFDILFYNGRVLSNLPLSERLTYLQDLFVPIEGRIMFSITKVVSTKQDVVDALNLAIDNREEGIMIKDPSAVYKPNSRNWIKVKPEYVGNVMNDLDLLIVGGYFGEGRRGGILSHFLLAVAVPSQDSDNPELFHSFAKVGSGYTLQELYQLLDRLKDNWLPYDKRKPPTSIILALGHKEKPDLWIEPSKSQIVQVKATEIISSERFKTGCTLRFPRVESVRYDKQWNQCMNINELEQLRKEAEGKLALSHFDSETSDPSPKKRRILVKTEVKSVPLQFRPADVSGVQQEYSTFSDKEMCILTNSSGHSKAELEKNIVKLGGTFVQNPGQNTYCVVSNKVTLRVKNLIQTGKFDIVKTEWLEECICQAILVPWTPFDMLFSKEETTKNMSHDYDEFGDNFYLETSESDLPLVFNNISKEVVQEKLLSNEEIAEIEFEYFPSIDIPSLFRTSKMYLDNKLCPGDASTKIKDHLLDEVELQICYFGGEIMDSITSKTTHVIVHTEDFTRLPALKALNQIRDQKFCLVQEDWVTNSISAKKLLVERHFFPA